MTTRAGWPLALAVAVIACSRPVKTARLSKLAPPTPAENDAAVRMKNRSCSPLLGLVFPGLGHLCLGKTGDGLAFSGLAAADIGGTVALAVTHEDDPETAEEEVAPIAIPLTALQDLWIYGVVDPLFKTDLARQRLYTPQDSPADLLSASFNLEVLKRPAVWAGILGTLAVGIGVSLLVERPDTGEVGGDPEIFGRRTSRAFGYPVAGALSIGLFSHVAIAEEALFRGWLQSSMARSKGETTAWVVSSLAFGAVHLGNLFAIERENWDEYLLYAMPVITSAGFYLGWTYQHEGYSLAPPVAVHFWYDTILSAVIFALDPDDSLFTTRISLPF